jgi:hypothetical protein
LGLRDPGKGLSIALFISKPECLAQVIIGKSVEIVDIQLNNSPSSIPFRAIDNNQHNDFRGVVDILLNAVVHLSAEGHQVFDIPILLFCQYYFYQVESIHFPALCSFDEF